MWITVGFFNLQGVIPCPSDWYSRGHESDPWYGYISQGFGDVIISMAILSLLLIQVGQLLVTGESMGTYDSNSSSFFT